MLIYGIQLPRVAGNELPLIGNEGSIGGLLKAVQVETTAVFFSLAPDKSNRG